MGITTYGVTSGTLSPTYSWLPQHPGWAVSSYSYVNPNVTVTTTANHNIQVGNTIFFKGVTSTATTNNFGSSYNVTAVTANTFTFNYGATTPSTQSGGTARLYGINNANVAFYLNGRYIFAFGNYYVYSTDGVNWDAGQLPTNGTSITSAAFDGTTYIFAAGTSGLWSSTTLAQGSWTQRSTFGGFFCHDVKWYGGGINRFVAIGSSTASANGAGGRIETALSGGATWTNQTLGGTVNQALRNSAWDGSNTIIAVHQNGIVVSTAGAASWTGYLNNVTTQPNMSGAAGAPNLNDSNGNDAIYWNPTAARWMTIASASGSFYGNTSTTTPTTYWTRQCFQDFFTGKAFTTTGSDGSGNATAMNILTFDGSFIYTWKYDGGDFQVMKWSANPTVLDTNTEIYPLTGILTGKSMPAFVRPSSATGAITGGLIAAVYGGNKWVTVQTSNNTTYPSNFIATVFQ